jgi:Fe-S cluster assembly ATPase SufC
MFELKNFYVKHRDRFLIENVNYKFGSPNKYQVICRDDEQKDAFIGGLLGYPEYLTFGNIIWQSKWKLEIKETVGRMIDKFILFTDKIPNFDFLTTQEFLFSLRGNLSKFNRLKINPLVKQYRLSSSFLTKKVGDKLTNEEKQKLQLIELYFLAPEFVIVDLKKPIRDFFEYLDASPHCFSVIMVITNDGAKFRIKQL